MAKNFEFIGFMQNHRDVEIIKLNDGTYVALDGWNGEIYADCWTCDQSGNAIDVNETKFSMKPITEPIKDSDDYETVSFERGY